MRKRYIYFFLFIFFIGISFVTLLVFHAVPTNKTLRLLHAVALGDSITVGERNCQHFDCEFEPNTYIFLFAKSLMKQGIKDFANYGYSGSTAACGQICQNNDIVQTSATSFPNAYIKKTVKLPHNQKSIETTNNLVNQTAPGIIRTNLGEFDGFNHSIITIAWGRNDEDTPAISLDAFRNALITIAKRLEKNPTNSVIFLTISPIDWLSWNSFPDRRHEFDDRIANQENPAELDAFFSAMVWEAAFATHAKIAPLSEYLWFHPNASYFSSDKVHPSTIGHQIIAKVLEDNTGNVFKSPAAVASGSAFILKANAPTYGQIVWEREARFYYAQPFYADVKKPFRIIAKTAATTIYANGKVKVQITTP